MRRDPKEFTLRLWSRSGPVEGVQHWGLWNTSKGSLWGEPAKSLSKLLYGCLFVRFAVELSIPNTNKSHSFRFFFKKENIDLDIFGCVCDLFSYFVKILCTRRRLFSWIISFINVWVYSCIDFCYYTSLKKK